MHLLAAVPNASDLEGHGFATECFVRQPPLLECGAALPPDRPGHGVEFDLEAAGAERMTGGGTELLPGNEAPVNIQGLAYHVA